MISDYENQLAQNDLAAAKAQLAQARAALVNAEKNLSYTVVKAPSAGYVGSIPNREGSLASPSSQQPLTTISDISEVYAYISFNEKQVLEMTQNGSVSLAKALSELPAAKLKLSDGSYYSELGKFSTMTGMLDNTTVRHRFAWHSKPERNAPQRFYGLCCHPGTLRQRNHYTSVGNHRIAGQEIRIRC